MHLFLVGGKMENKGNEFQNEHYEIIKVKKDKAKTDSNFLVV